MNILETAEWILSVLPHSLDSILIKHLWENKNVMRIILTEKIMRNENGRCFNYQYTLLHASSRYGRLDLLRGFLQNETVIDYRDELKRTPLWYAAAYNHKKTVQELLKYGARIRLKDRFGWSPLHIAAINGLFEMCEILLNNGAHPRDTDNQGFNPLAKAVWSKNPLSVALFIKIANESICISTFNDRIYPLHLAALKNEITICEILVENGAEIDCKNKEGITPLMIAAQNNYESICSYFLKMKASIDSTTKMGWTAIHMAARSGCVTCVKCLLNHSKSDYENQINGWTSLHVAASTGHVNVVEFLLASKLINFNSKTIDGLTAIDLAAKNGHLIILLKLIEKSKSIYNGPALHLAAISGHKDCVSVLIKFGKLNINRTWRPGNENLLEIQYSPVQYAIFSGQRDIACLLLIHGAKLIDAIKAYLITIIQRGKLQWLKHILKS